MVPIHAASRSTLRSQSSLMSMTIQVIGAFTNPFGPFRNRVYKVNSYYHLAAYWSKLHDVQIRNEAVSVRSPWIWTSCLLVGCLVFFWLGIQQPHRRGRDFGLAMV